LIASKKDYDGIIYERGFIMINAYLITIDTDWVSDSILAQVVDFLIENEIKSTWFITNQSPQIRRLLEYPNFFELGLHPNFAKGSTQGKTPRETLINLKKIIPEARSSRTHDLFQSTSLLRMLREEFDILYDVSILLPNTPNIVPHKVFFSKNMGLLRIPYFWEDDTEMYCPDPCFSLSHDKYHTNGIKIFNFHPIHIVLNSVSMDNYFLCKSEIDITKCALSELQRYINKSDDGTETFFRKLVHQIKNDGQFSGMTISDLAIKWKSLYENSSNRKD
jgi:hypothetical protein